METRAVANDAQTDTVFIELARFAAQGRQKQLHQRAHFISRSLPVLAGKGEQGQDFDALLGTYLDDRPHRIDARLVPGHARQETPLCPAIVAIHDNCDMTGYIPPGNRPDLFHETTTCAQSRCKQ